jgi:hypothetical protein
VIKTFVTGTFAMANRTAHGIALAVTTLLLLAVAMPTVVAGQTAAEPGRPSAPPSESRFPLGVYWPWETTAPVGRGAERAAKLDQFLVARLEQLASHHVNIIWTVNGPDSVAELTALCRLAEPRGIRVLAGSGWWAMHAGNATDAWAQRAVAHLLKVCRELEGGPRPMAFTLADEPTGRTMDVFGRYAAAAKAAKIPATTTVMWGDIDAAAAKAASLPWLCVDFYPFFGSHHGPRGDNSYGWFERIVRHIVRATGRRGQVPWVMAQAYQEVWGPARLEPDGQVTVLPGGGQHWLMPTPAQIRWQAWTAAALGAKGVFFFAYGVPSMPKPQAQAIKEPWAVATPTPTGGPTSLVSYPDFRPGPQFEAMGRVFAEIEPLGSLLLRLRTADEPGQLVAPAQTPTLAGDILNVLTDPASGALYAAVVASPKRAPGPLGVRLGPDVVLLTPIGGAPKPGPLGAGPGSYHITQIVLEPGQGALYRLETKPRPTGLGQRPAGSKGP